jgi:hypothetical protein
MRFDVASESRAAARLKVFGTSLVVALALNGHGCEADRRIRSPVSPSPAVATVPPVPDPSPAGERWKLTTTIVALEGSACFWRQPAGTRFENWTLSVERIESLVRFVYDVNNPHDNLLFVGTVNGQSFSAASESYRGFWPCAGSVTLSSSVVGSFSTDGRTLSGRERLVYRVDGGGDLVVSFEWNATRM